MTDRMRCCFCGTELEYNIDDMLCPNAKCSEYYKEYASHIWQALISGKKAQDALNRIERILLLDSEKPMTLTPAGKKKIKAIIASITKGDKE